MCDDARWKSLPKRMSHRGANVAAEQLAVCPKLIKRAVAKILDSLAQLAYKDAIFDAKEDWLSSSEDCD